MRRTVTLLTLGAACVFMTLAVPGISALARPAAPNASSKTGHSVHHTRKHRSRSGWRSQTVDTAVQSVPLAAKAAVSAPTSTLFGDQSLENVQDTDQAGQAEAFPFVASASGTAGSVVVYVDRSNAATSFKVGVYANASGKPGALLGQGSKSAPTRSAWNTISLSSVNVTSGTKYWLAVLGTGGQIGIRDRDNGPCTSLTSSQTNLSSLASTWSTGQSWGTCPISAYVTGSTGTPPPPAAPSNSAAPVMSGIPIQGQSLSTSSGTWTGSPTSYTYQWQDCDSSGSSCTNITGATASGYTLTSGDVNHTMRAVITATNAGGSTAASSAASSTVASNVPAKPSNTAAPAISGTTTQGQTLTTTNGTWTGSPTSYTYQWQDCDSSGCNCTNISGATASGYTLASRRRRPHDARRRHRHQRRRLAPRPPQPQPHVVASTVRRRRTNTGSADDQRHRHAGPDADDLQRHLDRQPRPRYTYQWQDCDSSGSNCTNISGATASSYTLTSTDVSHTIRAVVTATNAGGSTSATSAADRDRRPPTCRPRRPTPRAPAISGTTTQGQTPDDHQRHLDRQPDVLHLPVAGLRQLRRQLHQHQRRDRQRLHARPAATSTTRSAPSSPPPTPVAATRPPQPRPRLVASTAPAKPDQHRRAGDQRHHHPGPDPDDHQRHLDRQPDVLHLPVAGLRQLRQQLHQHQRRHRQRLHARQAATSTTRSAPSSPPPTPAAATRPPRPQPHVVASTAPATPSNTAAPAISGTTTQGQNLTTTNGTWTGSPTSYTYQWQDCDSSGSSCTNITGATASSYTLTSGDVNHTMRAVITATNAGGSNSATSAATALVASTVPAKPSNTAAPAISGTTTQGQNLTTTNGTWTGSPTSYTYQWQDCDSSGSNCTNITGATASGYTLTSGDVNHTMRTVITATNAGGSTSATSAATALVASSGSSSSAPVNTAAPAISGTTQPGQVLTATTGSWSNSPSSYSYQWYDERTPISGATGSTYTMTSNDVDHTIGVSVTATNNAGASSPAPSASTGVVVNACDIVDSSASQATTDVQNTANSGKTICLRAGTYSISSLTVHQAAMTTLEAYPGDAQPTLSAPPTLHANNLRIEGFHSRRRLRRRGRHRQDRRQLLPRRHSGGALCSASTNDTTNSTVSSCTTGSSTCSPMTPRSTMVGECMAVMSTASTTSGLQHVRHDESASGAAGRLRSDQVVGNELTNMYYQYSQQHVDCIEIWGGAGQTVFQDNRCIDTPGIRGRAGDAALRRQRSVHGEEQPDRELPGSVLR